MSFGGGFGGFGSNNNQQQNSGFGFGSNNNTASTTGGFGSTGFGSNTNTSGGLFGNSGGGGFGSGGFGSANTSSPFGQKPAFGSTTTTSGGGLFGGGGAGTTSTTTGGFGGFGSGSNQTSGFGSNSTSGGLFGANKPTAFGSNAGTGGGLFGGGGGGGAGGATTATGFGGTTTSSFGQTGSAFGSVTPAQNPGTDSIPFNPVSEKETGTGGQIQYQTITTMDQYKNWSFEELRVADYLKGKRFGTTNGQAGAFGQSSGFGSGFGGGTPAGFGTSGATGGGLFGSTNQNNSFGQSTGAGFGGGTSGSGFSSGTTGSAGLFGANKPATGGLFGSTTTTSSQQSGGLFGASNNTGFGAGATTANTGGFGSGGGLFNQTNQAQNKPFGGGFGSGTTSTGFGTGGTSFGQNNATNNAPTGGGLFGQSSTTTSNPFGGTPQNNNTTSNLFGGFGQNQQNQNQQQGGGLFGGGGGGFGNNNNQQQQNKPLFGSTTANTTPGLFGQNTNNQQQQSGGLFGNNNQQSGGLFGAKPAATGTGLFGNTQPASAGTGLFGNLGAQTQQNQTTGLFGQNNQNQKSLFGSAPGATGTGLFGNINQNNQQGSTLGSSLFNNQQNQQSQLGGGSFFGSQQAQQQPTNLFASLDANPYGNDQLFANLETPAQSVGPIATPLSSSQKVKRNAILPQHKLNPAASTRLITPQKRPPPGFGFSYSTYGTPGSAVSNVSPGGGFLGGSFGRSLGKSFSTSNLRGGYDSADSILAPGAFSPTPRAGYAAGSLKRLTIDRNVNTRGLFNSVETNGTITPSPLKKSVSFDTNANGQNGSATTHSNTSTSKALVRVESDDSSSPPAVNGTANGTADANKSKELAIVPEATVFGASSISRTGLPDTKDKPVGDYWMTPSLAELRQMSPQQLKKVGGFKVGRDNVGMIEYEVPVDLSNIPLDLICGGIVKIGIRNASTYGEDCPVTKPPVGKGLNVRSMITLENSWPRAKAGQLPVHEKKGPRFEKHIQRLKRVAGTEFIDYNGETGTWKFRVEHYTTYGLDYEGEPEHDDTLESSVLSPAQDMPTPKTTTPGVTGTFSEDITMMSTSSSGLDDTFQFQRQKRKNVPGGFGDEPIFEDERDMTQEQDNTLDNTQSFLGERSVGSFSEDGHTVDNVFEDESGSVEEQDMAGSFPAPDRTTEPTSAKKPNLNASVQPKSILKASVARRSVMDTPSKGALVLEGDWAEQLQRTVSPKKRDRQALRESQATVLEKRDDHLKARFDLDVKEKPITNSIDLMQSIWGTHDGMSGGGKGKETRKAQELKFPYAKRQKTHEEQWTESDKAFHQCCKPRWASDGTLIYVTTGGSATATVGPIRDVRRPIVYEHLDTHFAKLATPPDAVSETLKLQRAATGIRGDADGCPYAFIKEDFKFSDLANRVSLDTPASAHEHRVWQLAGILFDPITDVPDDLPMPLSKENEIRYRKERLSDFWQTLVQSDADRDAKSAKTAELKAIAYISGRNVADACQTLVEGRDFKLATMIAQLGGSGLVREEMGKQIDVWRNNNTLAEISEPIRALYELVSGNCAVCEGSSAAGSEDAAANFKLASRFNLDWRRAFGLRLWYGILPEEDVDIAVAQYESDISEGREDVKPVPWFVEQKIDMGWTDPTPEKREDILWGLLKLYAAQTKDVPVNAADILAPASVSGNPVNARLSWQLIQLLRARDNVDIPVQRLYGENTNFVDSTSSSSEFETDKGALNTVTDALTLTYAASLETDDHWTNAIWLYIHLSNPELRAKHIGRLLALHASAFSLPDTPSDTPPSTSYGGLGSVYNTLVKALSVPSAWLHHAKALYARSVLQSPPIVLHHLLAARDFVMAHNVLCAEVAPAAIIARDHDTLREALGGFTIRIGKKAGWDLVRSLSADAPAGDEREWALGGGVYFDFIHLSDLYQSHSSTNGSERRPVLGRLVSALTALGKKRLGSLAERAAVQEMSRQVAGWLEQDNNSKGLDWSDLGFNRVDVLGLPLGESGCGREVIGLAEGYFRGVLAYGR